MAVMNIRCNPKAIKNCLLSAEGFVWTHSYYIRTYTCTKTDSNGNSYTTTCTERIEVYEKNNIFSHAETLFARTTLQPGQYGWKFRFVLPATGQPSMNRDMGDAGCKVKYPVTFRMNTDGHFKGGGMAKVNLNVIRRPLTGFAHGVTQQTQLTPHFSKGGSVRMTSQIMSPSDSARPGMAMPLRFLIVNETKKSIKRVTATMHCYIRATARGHTTNDSKRLFKCDVSDYIGHVKPGAQTETQFDLVRDRRHCEFLLFDLFFVAPR